MEGENLSLRIIAASPQGPRVTLNSRSVKHDEKNSLRSLKSVNIIFNKIIIKFINYLHKVWEYAEILKRRLAKLEIENDRIKRKANFGIFCAVGAIIMSAVVFARSH